MELFLDSNAHIAIKPKALQAYVEYQKSNIAHGNPNAPNALGRKAAFILEKSREKIADLLGANPEQIFFASTATQACEWGLSILNQIPSSSFVPLIYPLEHSAVRMSYNSIFGEERLIYVDKHGDIHRDIDLINNSDKVVCSYVQSEIGLINPILKLSPRNLFSDITQAVGKIPINLNESPITIAACGAHKFGGPTGVGILYVENISFWKPFGSGSRYFSDRPGTPDVASILATSVALEEAISSMEERTKNCLEFRSVLEPALEAMNCEIISSHLDRVPNTTFFKLNNKAAHPTLFMLSDQANIHIGLGSACGSMYSGESLTMKRLGRKVTSDDLLRVSQWGLYGKKEAEYFIDKFKKIRETGKL